MLSILVRLMNLLMSSSEVRNDVFLSLTFTGVKLHLWLRRIPLASSFSETIKYPNDPDGEPLQSLAYFCSRDLFHSLDQTGNSEGRTGYF